MIKVSYKYLLFQGNNHDSGGGMEDLVLKFNSYDEFINQYKYIYSDWFQLVRTENYEWEEFSSKIVMHLGRDNQEDIKAKRVAEFQEWIKERLET